MTEQPTPRLAESIDVVGGAGKFSLKIDGQEFPWFISDDGVSTTVSGNNLSQITITILANKVSITDDWTP